MNSKCDQILSTDIEVKEHTLDWVIKNYGPLYRKVSNFVDSPPISFDIDPEIEWLLRLDVCSFAECDIAKVYLTKGCTASKNICVTLSLLNANEDVLQSEERRLVDDFAGTLDMHVSSIKIKNGLFAGKDGRASPDDTLIVRLRVTYHSLISSDSAYATSQRGSRQLELDVLEKLFNDKKFSDAQIIVGDRVFDVHKCVLDARSAYFSAMFSSEMKEKRENEVKIKDVSHEVMQEVLRFIYTGRVDNLDALKTDLFVAADEYNIEALKALCERALIRDFKVDNILDMLVFAEQYSSNNLKAAAVRFFNAHRKKILAVRGSKNVIDSLPPSILVDIIQN